MSERPPPTSCTICGASMLLNATLIQPAARSGGPSRARPLRCRRRRPATGHAPGRDRRVGLDPAGWRAGDRGQPRADSVGPAGGQPRRPDRPDHSVDGVPPAVRPAGARRAPVSCVGPTDPGAIRILRGVSSPAPTAPPRRADGQHQPRQAGGRLDLRSVRGAAGTRPHRRDDHPCRFVMNEGFTGGRACGCRRQDPAVGRHVAIPRRRTIAAAVPARCAPK